MKEECPCRGSVMRRWRAVNRWRRRFSSLPQLPRPEVPVTRAGRKAQCHCPGCVANRENARKWKLAAEDTPSVSVLDAEDRIALEKWNPEWGARA